MGELKGLRRRKTDREINILPEIYFSPLPCRARGHDVRQVGGGGGLLSPLIQPVFSTICRMEWEC